MTNTVHSLLEEIEQVVGGSNNLPKALSDKLRAALYLYVFCELEYVRGNGVFF